MDKQGQINISIPGSMAAGIKRLIDAGEFTTQAEYIRFLIRLDLPVRLATLELESSEAAPGDNPARHV